MDMAAEENHQEASTENNGSSPKETATSSKRRYSSEEVAEIIRLSLQDQEREKENTVDYDELLAIASEVGVDEDQIDRAVELLEEEQLTKDKERNLWIRFHAHCISFVAVNFFLVIVNVLTDSTVFWSMYVILGWGLFLLGHYAGLRFAPQFVELAMERTRHYANNKYEEFSREEGNVEFTVADAWELIESNGLATIEDDKLCLEYQTVDSVLGVYKSNVKTLKISFDDLTGARLEQKLWSSELVLQGKNLRTFRNALGAEGGRLRLPINRHSHRAAERLAQEIRAKLTV